MNGPNQRVDKVAARLWAAAFVVEAQIRTIDAWWRRHRKDSPDLLIRTVLALGLNRQQVGRAMAPLPDSRFNP